MKRLTILIDVDGVLANSQAALIYYYAILTHDYSTWDFRNILRPNYSDLCPLWNQQQITEAVNSETYFKILTPIAQAQQAIRRLEAAGHRVIYYTAQDISGRHYKQRWLENYFVAEKQEIIFTEPFAGKDEHVGDIFIDDWTMNLQSNQSSCKILHNMYNRTNDWKYDGTYYYTASWDQIELIILDYAL